MALTNIFSIKKPKYDTKSPIQGAAAKIGQAASYAPPNYAANAIKNTAGAAVGAASNFLNRFSQPSQQQNMSKAPQMSVAPKPQIQGSGMTSQYASNPNTYQAPVVKPPTTQPAAPGNVPGANANQSWLNYAQSAADRQKKLAEEQRTQSSQFIKDKYGLANKQLQEALPAAQQQFGQFKSNAEATIADLLAGGERQKSQAADYQGEAQRLAAQTLRETQGQTQRTFANLGTLDSRGEGSFGQATENQMSEFNRFTQQGLKALADKKAEIDSTVGQAERSARATIMQEEAKMNELARNIQYALQNNNLQEAQELTDAFNQSQQYIYDVEDALAQTQYQFALESQKLDDALTQTSTAGLSQEFLTTGQPYTQADAEYIIRNPEGATAYGKLLGGANGKPKSASALQVEGKAGAGLRALDTIEAEILNNPNILAQSAIPGSPGARQYEAAVSSITDALGGLRTGASVSPQQQAFYRNLLPKVGDSQETIQYKLNALKQELSGYAQGANNMGSDVPPELMSILGL